MEIMFVGRTLISGKYAFRGNVFAVGNIYPGNFFGETSGRTCPRRKGAFSKGNFPPKQKLFRGRGGRVFPAKYFSPRKGSPGHDGGKKIRYNLTQSSRNKTEFYDFRELSPKTAPLRR